MAFYFVARSSCLIGILMQLLTAEASAFARSASARTSTTTDTANTNANSRGGGGSAASPDRPENDNEKRPLYEVEIDYSAANEYVGAHYGAWRDTPYFERNALPPSSKLEPVWNAREGVLLFDDGDDDSDDDDSKSWKKPTVQNCGFALVDFDAPSSNRVVGDWMDLDAIRDVYLPEVSSRILERVYPGSRIRHLLFWNPVFREEKLDQTRPEDKATTPTAGFAKYPHIDMDVNAYDDTRQLVELFRKNHVGGGTSSGADFPTDTVVEAIERGCRFAIVNAWRNVNSNEPVRKAPLALFSPRYEDKSERTGGAFPVARPDPETSRWYAFPEIRHDELLVFCQYDRDAKCPSDTWHCALTEIDGSSGTDGGISNRKSFDVRCLIVFDEFVPAERDRFGPNRPRSLLSLSQSATFCSDQARRRSPQTD